MPKLCDEKYKIGDIELPAYICVFCSNMISTDYKAVENHEKKCCHNPTTHSCPTCRFKTLLDDGAWKSYQCSHEDRDPRSPLDCGFQCPDWQADIFDPINHSCPTCVCKQLKGSDAFADYYECPKPFSQRIYQSFKIPHDHQYSNFPSSCKGWEPL